MAEPDASGGALGGDAAPQSATENDATSGSETGEDAASASGDDAALSRTIGTDATPVVATDASLGLATDADAGDASTSPFVLSWSDDFDALDLSAWQLESFTYGGNLAVFSPSNASVANGILTIRLTPNPSDTAEPYLGVEMRSAKTLTYGKVSASMRFATGSGVVSGLVLFYTPFPNCNWNEIDIEHLGKTSTMSQLNCQVYSGTPAANCTTSVAPTPDPLLVNMGVDVESGFHQYDIEWTPSGVTTYIDGRPLRTWTKYISRLNLPQTVLLTIWASATAAWAGPLNASSAPTSADVDWIKVYDYRP